MRAKERARLGQCASMWARLGAVHGLEPAQDLVDEVLDVVVGERLLRVDDVVQVGVEQLGHEVDILPVLDPASVGHHDVLEAKHVLVLEVLQQPHLPQHPLAVDRVLEGVADLLDGHLRNRSTEPARNARWDGACSTASAPDPLMPCLWRRRSAHTRPAPLPS